MDTFWHEPVLQITWAVLLTNSQTVIDYAGWHFA
jgi:hypothetical protein